jgi:hypothetical protein
MEGHVDPTPGPVQHFKVRGDHGIYDVFVGAHVRYCTCRTGSGCSHLTAAVDWVLEQGRRVQGKATRADDFEACLRVRKLSDAHVADAIFGRLGA